MFMLRFACDSNQAREPQCHLQPTGCALQAVNYAAAIWASVMALLHRLVAFARNLVRLGQQDADTHNSTQYSST